MPAVEIWRGNRNEKEISTLEPPFLMEDDNYGRVSPPAIHGFGKILWSTGDTDWDESLKS